jgi:hypothetical protein
MNDPHNMHVSYISVQSNNKNSSPIIFDQLPYKTIATQDRVFPYYAPNSSIKHSKSDSKNRSQEIL